MSDALEQFEVSDNDGSSVAFTGNATTTVANVPTVAGDPISGVLMKNISNNKDMEVSFDNGTTFFPLEPGEAISLDVKGLPTQIQVQTPSSNADWKAVINFEAG